MIEADDDSLSDGIAEIKKQSSNLSPRNRRKKKIKKKVSGQLQDNSIKAYPRRVNSGVGEVAQRVSVTVDDN